MAVLLSLRNILTRRLRRRSHHVFIPSHHRWRSLGCMVLADSWSWGYMYCIVGIGTYIYPTSGGLYFMCKYLAPPKWVPEISWTCGWINLLGQIAGVASAEYGVSQLLLAAVFMGSDFSYTPMTGHTIAVMAAIMISHGMINNLQTSALEKLVKVYVTFHLRVLVSACIVLVMTKDKHDSTYVFTNVSSSSS